MPNKPVASCPGAAHIPHLLPHEDTCQRRVFSTFFFQNCYHPTALSSQPQTLLLSIALLLLSSNSFQTSLPQSLGSHSSVLLQDNTVFLLHKESSLFWHLQLNRLSISCFACGTSLLFLPGFQQLLQDNQVFLSGSS